jgi:PAS domain S-box-containing protein
MNTDTIKILLIEDEQAHCELIRRAFQEKPFGYELGVVHSLSEAREWILQSAPDLLLLDYLLPDGKGLDFYSQEIHPTTLPFILMTSYGDEQLATEALKSGALDYVVKSEERFWDMPHIVDRAWREWNHILERQRAEKALQESEKKYRIIFETTSTANMIVNKDMTIAMVNAEFEKISGYSKQAIEGKKSWQDIVIHEDFEKMCDYHRRRRQGKSAPNKYSFRFIDKDGQVKHCLMCVSLLAETQQSIASIIDISEQRRAEGKLLAKSEEQKLLLDNIETQIWYLSDPQRYKAANRARAEFLGYTKEELVQKSIYEMMSTEEAGKCVAWNRNIFENKESSHQDQWCLDVFGQWRLLSITKIPKLDANGHVEYIICTAEDLTVRKQTELNLKRSEARLNRALKVAQVATWERDLKSGEIFWSDEQYRLFGYEPDEVSSHYILHKHVSKNDLRYFDYETSVQPALTLQRDVCEFRFQYTKKNGQERFGYCFAEIEKDKDGQPLRIYGTMQDITETVKTEQALKTSRDNYQRLLQSTQRIDSFQKMVGKSKAMRRIYRLILQLADVETTVLVSGESGTGKELIVDALHSSGSRSKGPLIKVNCSALAEELLDSELFGHVRGAFTGAFYDKVGRIEAAEGGTLFLDEIGDVSPRIQLKLLRFLEEKQFERVGDSKTLDADVRIVAATNVDLTQKVQEGTFRKDLFYRLKVMPIYISPLRERTEDIPLLIKHFCKSFNQLFGKQISDVSKDVLKIFMSYHWPGNVRELEHAVEHACLLCADEHIMPEHLPHDLVGDEKNAHMTSISLATRKNIGREGLLDALNQAGGNKVAAAQLLGISRRTLYRKLHQFGISVH